MPHPNDPETLRTIAIELSKTANDYAFRLGDTLAVINATRLYKEWGFSTWKDYVEKEVHLNVSASYELLTIARWCQIEHLSITERRALSEVGRTKAYCIAHLGTKQSLDKWIKIAKKATCEGMRNRLYDEKSTNAPKTVSFWLYGGERQIIEKAMKAIGHTHGDDVRAGVLLTEVCLQFNNAQIRKKKRVLKRVDGKLKKVAKSKKKVNDR